jgi:large subunit ribosomal protein L18
MSVQTKEQARLRRHRRVRVKVSGTATRPRLAVYRSNARIYAQLIDDDAGHTLASASSREKELASTKRGEAPTAVGKLIA